MDQKYLNLPDIIYKCQYSKTIVVLNYGFGLECNRDKTVLANRIQTKLENTETWLRKSGMKINESKTCLCLFYNKDTTPIEIVLNGVSIKSSKTINVLGVIFDQYLQWSEHIAFCIAKSSKALTDIKMN